MRSQVVSFHCVLRNQLGQVISATFNRDVMTDDPSVSQGKEPMLAGLASGLRDLRTGERRQIKLSAEKAYGYYDPDLVIECRRGEIVNGRKLAQGDRVLALDKNGEQRMFRVVRTNGSSLYLDANHPLAGQDLVFDIEATEAREATSEELAESGPLDGSPLLH